MAVHRILENLFLIDLDLPLPGFYRFISSWIIKKGDSAIIIDPGPSVTINVLINALSEIEVRKIDYIFLTHIHLDHGGGCGDLARAYPGSPIVCHPKAVDHLADPDKLWEGSLDVLGDLALAYGKPLPVARETICTKNNINWKDYNIRLVKTPGHASHHMSFLFNDLLFAGEVAGVHIPLNGNLFIRPATPPPFRPQTALNSISHVAEMGPNKICYGHYGFLGNACKFLSMAKEQIGLWLDIIKERKRKGLNLGDKEIFEEILAKDSHVSFFNQFDPETRQREAYFIKNSIKGMLNFINKE